MKKIVYVIGLGLLLGSCNGGTADITEGSDTTATIDSSALPQGNIEIDLDALLAKFGTSTPMPFVQDSTYLEGLELNEKTALTTDEVRYLSYGFVNTDVSYEGLAPVQDFYVFDSLKADGSYEGFLETADIGMMVRSDAFVAQKVDIDDETSVLLWAVGFSTYEACPYSSGTILYGSVLKNGVVSSSTILGEDSGSGDPPVWGATLSLVAITPEGFHIIKRDQNAYGETDEDGNELVDESTMDIRLTIDENGTWKQEPIQPEI